MASNRVFAALLPVHAASYHHRHLPGDTEAKKPSQFNILSYRHPVIGQFLTQSVGWSIQLPICTALGLEVDGVWSIGQATYLFLDRQGGRGSWFSCLRMLRDNSSRQDLYHILLFSEWRILSNIPYRQRDPCIKFLPIPLDNKSTPPLPAQTTLLPRFPTTSSFSATSFHSHNFTNTTQFPPPSTHPSAPSLETIL